MHTILISDPRLECELKLTRTHIIGTKSKTNKRKLPKFIGLESTKKKAPGIFLSD